MNWSVRFACRMSGFDLQFCILPIPLATRWESLQSMRSVTPKLKNYLTLEVAWSTRWGGVAWDILERTQGLFLVLCSGVTPEEVLGIEHLLSRGFKAST